MGELAVSSSITRKIGRGVLEIIKHLPHALLFFVAITAMIAIGDKSLMAAESVGLLEEVNVLLGLFGTFLIFSRHIRKSLKKRLAKQHQPL